MEMAYYEDLLEPTNKGFLIGGNTAARNVAPADDDGPCEHVYDDDGEYMLSVTKERQTGGLHWCYQRRSPILAALATSKTINALEQTPLIGTICDVFTHQYLC